MMSKKYVSKLIKAFEKKKIIYNKSRERVLPNTLYADPTTMMK